MTATLSMVRKSYTGLRMVLVTLFGPDHHTVLSISYVNTYTMEMDTELGEYNPRERGLKAHLHSSIIR